MSDDAPPDLDFPLPGDAPPPPPGPAGDREKGAADDPVPPADDWPEITLREDDDPPAAAADGEDEFYDGSTFGLAPAVHRPPTEPTRPQTSDPTLPGPADSPEPPARADAVPKDEPPAPDADGDVPDGDQPDESPGPVPPRRSPKKKAPVAAEPAPRDAPGRPKLRDWLEARCRKEAKMYALAVAALGPVAFAATLLTWIVLKAAVPGSGWADGLLAAALTAGLFYLERVTRESRRLTLRVEPEDRDIEPVTLKIPRGAGLTWLMYLAGSRDHPGFVRFVLGVLLFGPRLCELVFKMARTARRLWAYDADLMADPVKTLVRAEGKVSFAAFLEAHRKPTPQGLIDRLALIDGVLFLPTSNPPGLCTSGAMKDEFAAWRERWREERRADTPLYD